MSSSAGLPMPTWSAISSHSSTCVLKKWVCFYFLQSSTSLAWLKFLWNHVWSKRNKLWERKGNELQLTWQVNSMGGPLCYLGHLVCEAILPSRMKICFDWNSFVYEKYFQFDLVEAWYHQTHFAILFLFLWSNGVWRSGNLGWYSFSSRDAFVRLDHPWNIWSRWCIQLVKATCTKQKIYSCWSQGEWGGTIKNNRCGKFWKLNWV